MRWLRLYHETPSDPKLRRIAHTSGTTVGHVLAVWVSMMCHASEQPGEARGTLTGWGDTDCGINLGIDPAIVFAIRREMEARLLDGKKLIAWDKRQYDSDSAAVRTKRWREKKTQQNQSPSDGVTARDVTVTAKSREEEKREEKKEGKKEAPLRAARVVQPAPVLPSWLPLSAWAEFCEHRKQIRKPMTQLAAEKQIAALGKLVGDGEDAEFLINRAIANGWQGIFSARGANRTRGTPGYDGSKPTGRYAFSLNS